MRIGLLLFIVGTLLGGAGVLAALSSPGSPVAMGGNAPPTATPTCTHNGGWNPIGSVNGATYTPTVPPYAFCAGEPLADPYLDNATPINGSFSNTNFPLWRADINNTNSINSGDQLALGKAIAHCVSNPCIPTSTPSPTPSPTPTATPTSEAFGELIKSVDDTPHEGCIPGTSGFSWEDHGEIQNDDNNSNNGLSGWLSFQEQCGGSTGLTMETRNFQVWIFNADTWSLEIEDTDGSQVHPTPPHEGGVIDDMGAGPNFTMPDNGVGSQAWSFQSDIPDDIEGFITCFEARLPSGAPSGTNLITGAGGDFWPFAGSSSGALGAAVGHFRVLTSSYKWVCATNMTEGELLADPPPI